MIPLSFVFLCLLISTALFWGMSKQESPPYSFNDKINQDRLACKLTCKMFKPAQTEEISIQTQHELNGEWIDSCENRSYVVAQMDLDIITERCRKIKSQLLNSNRVFFQWSVSNSSSIHCHLQPVVYNPLFQTDFNLVSYPIYGLNDILDQKSRKHQVLHDSFLEVKSQEMVADYPLLPKDIV